MLYILAVLYRTNITDNRMEKIWQKQSRLSEFLFILITFLKITHDYYVVYITRQI